MEKVPPLGDYLDPQPEDAIGINGIGWGMDLGATIEMDINMPVIGLLARGRERLRLGVSLTDIGDVIFTEKAGQFEADSVLEWQGFEFDQQRINEEFNGNRDEYIDYVLQDSLGAEIYGSFAPVDIERITHSLPTRINVGAQLVMRKLSLSVDLGKDFVEQGFSSKRVSFSGGLEYRLLGFLPLRVGVRTGGISSTSYSAGLGLEFRNFEFSFAASTVRRSMDYGTNAGAAWSGLVFRF